VVLGFSVQRDEGQGYELEGLGCRFYGFATVYPMSVTKLTASEQFYPMSVTNLNFGVSTLDWKVTNPDLARVTRRVDLVILLILNPKP
jgi:hypothetical protein